MARINIFDLFRHSTLILVGSLFLLPFFWMIITSLKPEDENIH